MISKYLLNLHQRPTVVNGSWRCQQGLEKHVQMKWTTLIREIIFHLTLCLCIQGDNSSIQNNILIHFCKHVTSSMACTHPTSPFAFYLWSQLKHMEEVSLHQEILKKKKTFSDPTDNNPKVYVRNLLTS